MSQEHLDRLTAIDASFLHQEGPNSHMHVGALTMFEGPPPPYTEVLDTLRGRLHLVPRYRQRLTVPPAGTGRPLWVDDASFSLEYHVRHTALPHPGSEQQLLLLAGRIFSQQLDRSKPLWEVWMVEGLADGGFALITKTHHALIDGIAGVDIAQVIFDLGPVPAEVPHPDEAWEPAPTPTGAQVLASGTLDLLRTGVRTAAAAASLATRPKEALRSARVAVEGLEDNRFALITKTHHALIDGIAGVDIAQVIFDLTPVPAEVPHPDEAWAPAPEPSGAQLLASGTMGLLRTGVRTADAAAALATRPTQALRSAREAVEGLGEVAWAGLNPAPATPLNVEIGPHRRFLVVRNELADFKAVKDVFGGTVNDVVLTVVSGALRTWLHSRGVRTEGMELRALVPVSIRAQDERGTTGNRIAAMRGPLPVYIEDPVARLRAVKVAMDGLKESKQAVGAEVLASVQNFAPPTILAQASRLNFSTRLFNLIVTNIPGPQFPLYVRGREMLDVFPVAFLPKDHALAVAIMSYHGRMNFGLLGDYDALRDLDVIGEGIEASLAELLALARRRSLAQRSPAGV